MRKYVLIATAAASLFASYAAYPAQAASKAANKTPNSKRIEQCSRALSKNLVAPLEAKVINSYISPNGSSAYICFQARTRGGGYAQAGGTCSFEDNGALEKAEIGGSEFMQNVYCDLATK